MSEKLKSMLPVGVACIGALLAFIISKTVNQMLGANSAQILIPYDQAKTRGLTMAAVVNGGLGLVMVLFGSRIHRLVRWLGIGWAVGVFGAELIDWYATAYPTA